MNSYSGDEICWKSRSWCQDGDEILTTERVDVTASRNRACAPGTHWKTRTRSRSRIWGSPTFEAGRLCDFEFGASTENVLMLVRGGKLYFALQTYIKSQEEILKTNWTVVLPSVSDKIRTSWIDVQSNEIFSLLLFQPKILNVDLSDTNQITIRMWKTHTNEPLVHVGVTRSNEPLVHVGVTRSGLVGKPRLQVLQEHLQTLHNDAGFRWADIGRILGISDRTLRRCYTNMYKRFVAWRWWWNFALTFLHGSYKVPCKLVYDRMKFV